MISRRARELARINSQIVRKADELAAAIRDGAPWQKIQREIVDLRKAAESKAAEPIPVMSCTKCGLGLADNDYFIVNAYESIQLPDLNGVPMQKHLALPFCAVCNAALLAEYGELENA